MAHWVSSVARVSDCRYGVHVLGLNFRQVLVLKLSETKFPERVGLTGNIGLRLESLSNSVGQLLAGKFLHHLISKHLIPEILEVSVISHVSKNQNKTTWYSNEPSKTS